jgi:hypothetical protein
MIRLFSFFIVALAALGTFLAAQNQSIAKRTLYIQATPDAQAMKEEIVKKVVAWGGVSIVTLPAQADLILDLMQSGKLNLATGSGDKGAAVLKDAHTGEDLWSDSRGGGWSMRGFSNRSIGRKLGGKLVEFLQIYLNKAEAHR